MGRLSGVGGYVMGVQVTVDKNGNIQHGASG